LALDLALMLGRETKRSKNSVSLEWDVESMCQEGKWKVRQGFI
jgi:hypothetical protein